MAIIENWYEAYVSDYGRERPSQFPKALAESLRFHIERGKTRLLDIGCGSGVIGIYCLIEHGAQSVTFTDLMPEWTAITRRNLDRKLEAGVLQPLQVEVWEARDLREITPAEVRRFDLLVFNPPQLPKAYVDDEAWRQIEGDAVEKTFRTAGLDGLDIARLFFGWYAHLPMPKPDAIILFSSFLGRHQIEQAISQSGLQPRGEPIVTDATLRPFLKTYAEIFSRSPAETTNRLIEKHDSVWHKKLLTYRLTSK